MLYNLGDEMFDIYAVNEVCILREYIFRAYVGDPWTKCFIIQKLLCMKCNKPFPLPY